MNKSKTLTTILILIAVSLVASACSDSGQLISGVRDQNKSAFADQSTPEGMLAFEGRVFVASTKPVNARWHLAGWQVADQPVVGEEDSVPTDCTLYPHQGVDDQWIGSCSGNTFIPRDGANHIAVMHTQPDGTTKLVQVAPPPVASEP